jgi:hypothetical protein
MLKFYLFLVVILQITPKNLKIYSVYIVYIQNIMKILPINLPEINWDDTIPSIPQENNSNFYDAIQWTRKNFEQKNFNEYPIILSCSNKYFSTPLGKNVYSYKFIGYNDWNEALKLINTRKCIYEDFLIGKPYLDYEQSVDAKDYKDNKNHYDKEILKRFKIMIRYIERAINILLSDDRFKNKDYEILAAKSHGFINDGTRYKFSFHFIVNGPFRFKNTNDARQLANLIKSISRDDVVVSKEQPSEEDAKKPEDGVTDYIDMSVYKTNPTGRQKFRCLYSPKTVDDNRMLVPIDHNGNIIDWKKINILDYMVGYNDIDDIEYFDSIPIPIKNGDANKNKAKKTNLAKKKQAVKEKNQSANIIQSEDKKPMINKNKPVFDSVAHQPPIDKNIDDDSIEDIDDQDSDSDQDQDEEIEYDKNDKTKRNKKQNEMMKSRRLIEGVLKNTIRSAYIDGTRENEDGIVFYTFNYRHNEDCCIHGNDTHDHLGGYAYIKDGCSVYADCYSEKCKDYKARNIGNILDKSYWLTHNDFEEINSKYIGNDETAKKEIHEFIESKTNEMLIEASGIGTGKTMTLREITEKTLEYKENARILVISTRISYADDVKNNVFKDMNFSHYKEVKGCLSKHNRLIVSLESLHRLFEERVTDEGERVESLNAYDLIILDEVVMICSQFFSDTIEKKIDTFNTLMTLLHTAKKIVTLDADLDNKGFCLIDSLNGHNPRKIRNVYKNPPRKYTMVNDYEKYS